MAVINIPGKLAAVEKQFTTGAPVSISWSNRWGKNKFIGYVHHVRAHYGSDSYSTQIICVSASFPMVAIKQRVFESTTADHVIRQIAIEHGLRPITEPHPRLYETIPQPTISDWALACRLARETGYVLRADQTTLLFLPRSTFIKESRPIAQTMSMTTGVAANLTQLSSVFSFDPILADYLPEAGIDNNRKIARAVNPRTGDELTMEYASPSNVTSGIFSNPIDLVANSVQDAMARLNAVAEASRFVHRARVLAVGSPVTQPERMVYLNGLPRPYDGFWTVLSVTHRIQNTGQYLMEMEVGSEDLTDSTSSPGSTLSPEMRDKIVAKDISEFKTIQVMDSESTLDVLPTDYNNIVGRAFDRARWRTVMYVEA
jgi:phage protein D